MTTEQLKKLVALKDLMAASERNKAYVDALKSAVNASFSTMGVDVSENSSNINAINQRLDALVGSEAAGAIDTFNEIVAFLDGISGTTLDALITQINSNIAAAKAAVIVDSDNTDSHDKALSAYALYQQYQRKENGKGLSTNDFTDVLKSKLEGYSEASDSEVEEMLDEVYTNS